MQNRKGWRCKIFNWIPPLQFRLTTRHLFYVKAGHQSSPPSSTNQLQPPATVISGNTDELLAERNHSIGMNGSTRGNEPKLLLYCTVKWKCSVSWNCWLWKCWKMEESKSTCNEHAPKLFMSWLNTIYNKRSVLLIRWNPPSTQTQAQGQRHTHIHTHSWWWRLCRHHLVRGDSPVETNGERKGGRRKASVGWWLEQEQEQETVNKGMLKDT